MPLFILQLSSTLDEGETLLHNAKRAPGGAAEVPNEHWGARETRLPVEHP